MYAASREVQRPGDAVACLLEKSLATLVARQLSQKQKSRPLFREKMKKLLQGPGSELSLSQNHRHPLSPVEIEADAFGCGIKRTCASPDFPHSQGKSREASRDRRTEEAWLAWDGYLSAPRAAPPVQEGQRDPGRVVERRASGSLLEQSKGPQGPDLLSPSPDKDWRRVAEEREGLCIPRKPPGYTPYRPKSRDRSADVIEYIVNELQGISRIQSEIAELQQHLTLIKGSVDEVSSCVDTVLSEIEGLQHSGGPAGKAPAGPKARKPFLGAPGKEPVLHFHGIPEQEGENTKELVCSLLSKYHCFNGIQRGTYIKGAYRSGPAAAGIHLAPRPAIVELADDRQRDLILQKSILLQSAGVTIVAGGEPSHRPNGQVGLGVQLDALPLSGPGSQDCWAPGTLHGDGVRTAGDGQFQLDPCHVGQEEAIQEVQGTGQGLSLPQKPTRLTPERESTMQTFGSNKEALHNSNTPSCCTRSASPKPPEGPGPKSCHEERGWSSVESLRLLGKEPGACEGGKLGGFEATDTSKERASPAEEEDKARGLLTPAESETDCEATTLEFLSPEQGSLLEEAPVAIVAPACEATVRKLVGSSETLKDLIQIDLNEQDPTEQVFRDVLENSQYFLEHSRESIDLVDMRFYTNKLGKALSHFRSALQVVFHKLETGDPEVLLESEKGVRAGSEPAPALCNPSARGKVDSFAESPLSPLSSESQGNTTLSSESVGLPQRPPPSAPLSLEEGAPGPGSPLDAGGCVEEAPLASPAPGSPPGSQPSGCRPMSLEKVCAETIYLNKCINNFKNVLREKRQMRRRLLKDVAQEPSWASSAEEIPSGTRQTISLPLGSE